jgi:hypothetical protein
MSAVVELHATISELEAALKLARAHHGTQIEYDAPGGRRRPEVAAITRDLLCLSDRLSLLAGMVRQEYWAIKGEPRAVEA